MKGTKIYRHKDNPQEEIFYNKFLERFGEGRQRITLCAIVFGWKDGYQNYPEKELSEEEETICVNLIQWLGSPVGEGFLRDCGFVKSDENKTLFV